jgi:general stress protein 26
MLDHLTRSDSRRTDAAPDDRYRRVMDLVRKRSFCTLATSSAAQRPHVAGVLYAAVDGRLYVNTVRGSRKARNIAENPNVAVCIPVRRLPVGPPSTVQFQATAEVLAIDDPEIVRLLDAGKLKAITSHGELDVPDDCFVRITPVGRIATYGIGMPLHKLMRDPMNLADTVDLPR